ncbi:excinuclease ABC subunit UvrC [Kiritimatiellaeota bacterium B1221]|nr:excinuclease ABC subunit UvrC [Kiritimatiellaeota bacterium B1221]
MPLSKELKAKLAALPAKPGVYLMRDRNGKVIYVGKAKSLRNRVRNYFQSATLKRSDPKIRGLIHSICDLETIVVHNEAEAILTEGKLIKEYKPFYNTLFKDDKRFILLRIHLQDPFPFFRVARIQKPDGATYLGPYVSSTSARVAKEFVESHYGLRRCRPTVPGAEHHRHCMADILSFCSAPCIGKISREAYRLRAEEAVAFLKGERREVLKELEKKMTEAAQAMKFEKAAQYRDTLLGLRKTIQQRAKGTHDQARMDDEAREGLAQLKRELRLPCLPRVIETFDISNTGGAESVASMVCSVEGRPQRNRYKRFKIKTVVGPDDPRSMAEAAHRRYSRLLKENKPLPDLVVFDGGITQLRAGRQALDELGLQSLPAVGLAKRFEEVVWDLTNQEPPIRMPMNSPGLKILRAIRDEAHRFALTYHRSLRDRRIRESLLDDIPGIGDKRKMILLKHFGSVQRIKKASVEEIAEAPGIGKKFAETVFEVLNR